MSSTGEHSAFDGPGDRDFDIVVLGATGLTGRLVVARLIAEDRFTSDQSVGDANNPRRWAVAGPDGERLDAVVAELGAADVPSFSPT